MAKQRRRETGLEAFPTARLRKKIQTVTCGFVGPSWGEQLEDMLIERESIGKKHGIREGEMLGEQRGELRTLR